MEQSDKGYEAQVLRGSKWSQLLTPEQLAKEPENSSKPGDVAVYLKSCKKAEAKKAETKPQKVK